VTTVGLCVHSLAEGVAMGSSQFSNFLLFIPLVSAQSITHSGLGLTVVIALFLHKIPEGIGFGSFLTFKEPGKIQIIACLTVRILNMTI
jgi:zinc transporter ZupT